MIIPGFNGDVDTGSEKKVSFWVYDTMLPKCYGCGEYAFGFPTNYCPECGAFMLNKKDALRVYKEIFKSNENATEENKNE